MEMSFRKWFDEKNTFQYIQSIKSDKVRFGYVVFGFILLVKLIDQFPRSLLRYFI